MYWEDARERHGTGRRVLRQPDNVSAHFAGYPQDDAKPNRGAAARGGYGGGYGGGMAPEAPTPAGERSPAASGGRPAEYEAPPQRGPAPTQQDLFGRPASNAASPPATPGVSASPYTTSRSGLEPADLRQNLGESCGRDDAQGGRRDFGGEAQMVNMGMSSPPVERGRGRKFGEPTYSHAQVFTNGDFAEETAVRCRKTFTLQDHLKSDVLQPVEDIPVQVPKTTSEMKAAIKECLAETHGMMVSDESRWANALVEKHGCNWRFQALTVESRSVGREGNSARAIAEKFSMMPVTELRHFGLRFTGKGDARPSMEDSNPTLLSPGVHALVHKSDSSAARPGQSARYKNPEEQQRRYISSGKDHWVSMGVGVDSAPGMHGTNRDMAFEEGIERGIGHGKRRIGTRDSLFAGQLIG